jgi:hypothetical protein
LSILLKTLLAGKNKHGGARREFVVLLTIFGGEAMEFHFVFCDKGGKLSAIILSALFLCLQASLLATPPQRSYPDISAGDVSAYVLMMDMANDGAHAVTQAGRFRWRFEFLNTLGLAFLLAPQSFVSSLKREWDIFTFKRRGNPSWSQRFCMASRK